MEPGEGRTPRARARARAGCVVGLALVVAMLGLPHSAASAANASPRATSGDWLGYMGGPLHQSVATDTVIQRANINALSPGWKFKLPAVGSRQRIIFATPATWRGTAYVAGDTGLLYAINLSTGAVKWKRDFGVIPMMHCKDAQGIVGSPAVRSDASGNPFVYINAPDGYLYELNGTTGAVVWRTVVKVPSKTTNDTLPWSSPTLSGGRVYVGISSNCDSPFVRGALKSYDAITGKPVATAWTMPPGFQGAGVWTSVASDGASVYVSTASVTDATQAQHPPTTTNQFDQYSIVKYNAKTLVRTGKFVAPPTTTFDPDFASSPILFTATVAGKNTSLVGACRKDGFFYAVRTDTMKLVWSRQVQQGTPGGQSNCLGGAVFDGARLFLNGGSTKIGGVDYLGSVRRVDPATGAVVWERGLPGVALGPGSYNRNGILAFATADYYHPGSANNALYLLDPANGAVLRVLRAAGNPPELAQPIWAGGQLLQSNFDSVVAWRP